DGGDGGDWHDRDLLDGHPNTAMLDCRLNGGVLVADRVAVITGGGTGIGRASGLALAKDGFNVVVNYSRSAKEAEQTAAEIERLGVKAAAVQGDVADRQAAENLIKQAIDKFGRIDVLVNSAGLTKFIPYPKLDEI